MEFAPFDRRRYPTLGVREGYREWAETYEDVVQDEMDLRLLARIESVDWAAANRPEFIGAAAHAVVGAIKSHYAEKRSDPGAGPTA